MQKDFKIGLGVGLLFVVAVAFWLSTRPDLSTEARVLHQSPNTPSIAAQSEDRPVTPNIEQRKSSVEQTLRIHVVEKGETLSAISAKYYGSPNQWPRIVAANRESLNDPNRLLPGSKLVIPQ